MTRSRLGLRGTSVALALVVGAAGGLASCNVIVGAGSYSVGGGDSGATSDGSLDTGSPADTGVAMEASGDTGAPDVLVDSGTGGDTAPPAESGVTCGTGLPTTNATFQQLVKSCALAVSCAPNGFNVNISQCIGEDFLHSTAALACVSTINNCADFTNCLGFGKPSSSQCPSMATAPSCDTANNVAINCGSGRYIPVALDCTVLGGTCQLVGGDGGAAADCQVVSSCAQADDGTQYCQGNTLYTCIGGVGYGQSCTTTHSTCVEDPFNGTNCYFNVPPCSWSGTDTYTCSGGNVGWCTSFADGGGLFSFNCGAGGMTCVPNADPMGNAECLAPGCTNNDVSNCTESCTGSKANVCVGGAQYTFDCATIPGFTTCAMLTDSNFNPYVACQ